MVVVAGRLGTVVVVVPPGRVVTVVSRWPTPPNILTRASATVDSITILVP